MTTNEIMAAIWLVFALATKVSSHPNRDAFFCMGIILCHMFLLWGYPSVGEVKP